MRFFDSLNTYKLFVWKKCLHHHLHVISKYFSQKIKNLILSFHQKCNLWNYTFTIESIIVLSKHTVFYKGLIDKEEVKDVKKLNYVASSAVFCRNQK